MLVKDLQQSDPDFLTQMQRILMGEHWDPHHFLGLHPFFDGKQVIRLYRPGAQEVFLEVKGKVHPAHRIHESGFFELVVDSDIQMQDYLIYHQNGMKANDPYACTPFWGEIDSHLFNQGVHYKLYEKMGAHLLEKNGIKGVCFTLWAPSAVRVSLVADFNYWDGRVNPLRSVGQSGVWELFIPGLTEGERYKFEIKTQQGETRVKSDPYAFASELRPKTASIVASLQHHTWRDEQWISKRHSTPAPMNIYELHLGSWKQKHGQVLNYRELATQLVSYCKQMGFTHVEFLPIAEHPLDESWGYQVSGFYAVTARYGSPHDFQHLVDTLHQNEIGVILDWVPAHFPTDDFSLARFDGTALYEHADPRQGYHPHWNTCIFNYGRREVSNFLIANAIFWFDQMHIDGLRVDAVASMLYLDYGRTGSDWVPNAYGGKENLEAIEFIKHLNSIVHKTFPTVMMIAEESTSFNGVTRSVDFDGLGFDYKWNMGWMNDTLRYFQKDSLFRTHHHRDLTFGLLYAFSEKFILPLSHDEVVHGKGSLLAKMPGDYWQKFANLRLLLTYQICQPGKKILFMGAELGQWNEWHVKEQIHWPLLQYPIHQGIQTLVKEINHFYLKEIALWQHDFDFTGFEWVDFADAENSIISYLRKSDHDQLLCLHNFTPALHKNYFLKLANLKEVKEVFNSDEEKYGGSGQKNDTIMVQKEGCFFLVPPLATIIFRISFS